MTKQEYINLVGNTSEAIAFEQACLECGDEFLSKEVLAVKNQGVAPDSNYWQWLVDCWTNVEFEKNNNHSVTTIACKHLKDTDLTLEMFSDREDVIVCQDWENEVTTIWFFDFSSICFSSVGVFLGTESEIDIQNLDNTNKAIYRKWFN